MKLKLDNDSVIIQIHNGWADIAISEDVLNKRFVSQTIK